MHEVMLDDIIFFRNIGSSSAPSIPYLSKSNSYVSVADIVPPKTTSTEGGGKSLANKADESGPSSGGAIVMHLNDSTAFYSTELVVSALVFVIIIAWSTIGNSMVIVAVYKDQRLQNITNYFICSLAVADLLVALLIMPLASLLHLMGSWEFGPVSCTMWTSGDILCCTASILMLTAISLDRYWAVSQPVEYREKMTDRRCAVIIAFIWIFSTFLAIAQILWRLIIESEFDMRACNYTLNKEFRIVSSMSSFFVPLSIMIFAYVKIFSIVFKPSSSTLTLPGLESYVARNSADYMKQKIPIKEETGDSLRPLVMNGDNISHNKFLDNLSKSSIPMSSNPNLPASSQTFNLKKEEIITARLVGIVIGCFVVCWLPFFTLYVLEAFCTSCEYSAQVSLVFLWLGYLNSALNPIIYLIFDKQHRDVYKTLGKTVFNCFLDNFVTYHQSPEKELTEVSRTGIPAKDTPTRRLDSTVKVNHLNGKRYSSGHSVSENLKQFHPFFTYDIAHLETSNATNQQTLSLHRETPSTSQGYRSRGFQHSNNPAYIPNCYSQTSINVRRTNSQPSTPGTDSSRKYGNSEMEETQKKSLEQRGFKTATLLTIEPLNGVAGLEGVSTTSDFSSLEELELIEANSRQEIASHSPIISQV